MLILRKPQLDALLAAADAPVAARITTALATWSLGGRSGGSLRAEVDRAVARARAHGLTWESSIADFVGLAIQVGPEFDRHPLVAGILADPALPPNLRPRALVQRLSANDWAAVRRASRPS